MSLVLFASAAWADEAAAQIACRSCPWDPATGTSIQSPFVGDVVVFFAAHPDDETIGMAASIMHEVASGKRVFLELMTHGETSNVINTLHNNGTCTWHPGAHVYTLTVPAFGNARVIEFIDSAFRMGVEGIHISSFPSGALTQSQVQQRINYWLSSSLNPNLRGVAASDYLDPGTINGVAHPDHVAVWDALVATAHPGTLGYLIYNYRTHLDRYTYLVDYTYLCAAKLNALDAYKVWAPNTGRYAIGYHSTPYLMGSFNAVLTPSPHCPEFVVVPGAVVAPPGPSPN